MKESLFFIKRIIIASIIFFLGGASLNCYAVNPELTIITDKAPGVSVSHGLTKLTDALLAKKISFEIIESVKEAKGKWIIVTGLASGTGEAARLLKAGGHSVPSTAEALTIWKSKKNDTPLWVISGSDDRGLMYALLDVANRIGWSADKNEPMSAVKEITEKPAVSERAISIYTMNRTYWESRLYDEAYWAKYLDMLAQNRFNTLAVIFGYENGGFLAPCYPYFFDVEGFPDVTMVGITPQQQQHNLDAFNRLIQICLLYTSDAADE